MPMHRHADILPLAIAEQSAVGLSLNHRSANFVRPLSGSLLRLVVQQPPLVGEEILQEPVVPWTDLVDLVAL